MKLVRLVPQHIVFPEPSSNTVVEVVEIDSEGD